MLRAILILLFIGALVGACFAHVGASKKWAKVTINLASNP
jgi:hypothetical protein